MSPDRWCPPNTQNFYDQIDDEIEYMLKENTQLKRRESIEEIEKLVDLLPDERLKNG